MRDTIDTTCEFARLLRRLRMQAGLSQEALAELASISTIAISGYERGLKWTPRRETVAMLANALHLSDRSRTEFEATAERKRASFSATNAGGNLPWQATSFVGRPREIGEISKLLAPRRLVTVTGSGGIGKTRTALEIASRRTRAHRDGLWFVDLAPIRDETYVLGKLATVLNIQLPKRGDPLATLVGAIKARELLLILDNCEHVVAAVRTLCEAILRSCPDVTLLATSRERVRVAGEHIYKLATLPIPATDVATATEGLSYGALELFAERATMAQHDFVFSSDDVAAVTDICRRLDGIALAIELAAARLPVLGLNELRTQLASPLLVLAGGYANGPDRQRTLRATISWSHDLLDDTQRAVFRRIAVFANGWTLDAAEVVCADDHLDRAAVVEALLCLVEKSLVSVDLDTDQARYSLYESTRAHALERLADTDEGPSTARRHAQWAATFADRAFASYEITPLLHWKKDVRPEIDNAIAALEWSLTTDGDAVLAGRIASGLRGCWQFSGLGARGHRYINAALERLDPTEHPALVGRLLVAQSRFLHGPIAVDGMRRAIDLFEMVGDRRMLARCYNLLSYALAETGEYVDAQRASEISCKLLCDEGLRQSVTYVSALCSRAAIFYAQGRLQEAKEALADVPILASALEDEWSIAWCQTVSADIEFSLGNVQRAVELGTHALASSRRIRSADQEICSLANLACYHLALGETDAAEEHARSVLCPTRIPHPKVAHVSLQHLATVAAMRGNAAQAARTFGYVNAWFERMKQQRDPSEQKGCDVLLELLRENLAHEDLAALVAQGAQMTEEMAFAETLRT